MRPPPAHVSIGDDHHGSCYHPQGSEQLVDSGIVGTVNTLGLAQKWIDLAMAFQEMGESKVQELVSKLLLACINLYTVFYVCMPDLTDYSFPQLIMVQRNGTQRVKGKGKRHFVQTFPKVFQFSLSIGKYGRVSCRTIIRKREKRSSFPKGRLMD
jgi:hypothetical protein